MVRGWKSLDCMAFSRAIQDSKLSLEHSHLDALSIDDLFNLYSATMTQLLNQMLPLRKVLTRHRPLAVWFDGECRRLRRRTRHYERRYRRSRNPADRCGWVAQLRSLQCLYRQKEADHCETSFRSIRRTLSVSGHFLGQGMHSAVPSAFSAEDFLQMMTTED